jgi:CBS domain-containing protein
MLVIEKFARPVVTAGPMEPLSAVAHLMEHHQVGAVVIAENRRPVGIITDRDLALELGAHGLAASTPAARVMNSPVQIVDLRYGVFQITQQLQESRVRRLPIVDADGCLAGIVTVDDVLRLLSKELSNLIEAMATETPKG